MLCLSSIAFLWKERNGRIMLRVIFITGHFTYVHYIMAKFLRMLGIFKFSDQLSPTHFFFFYIILACVHLFYLFATKLERRRFSYFHFTSLTFLLSYFFRLLRNYIRWIHNYTILTEW